MLGFNSLGDKYNMMESHGYWPSLTSPPPALPWHGISMLNSPCFNTKHRLLRAGSLRTHQQSPSGLRYERLIPHRLQPPGSTKCGRLSTLLPERGVLVVRLRS